MASDVTETERYRVDEERGVIELLGTREDRFVDLHGGETTKERTVVVAKIELDEDVAEDVYAGVRQYLADEKASGGPPGEKPMHQRFAEVEPPR